MYMLCIQANKATFDFDFDYSGMKGIKTLNFDTAL